MKKNNFGVVCLLAGLALIQSCGQSRETAELADNQEVTKKVQRPVIVEIEDERDKISKVEVAAPLAEAPVAAGPLGPDVPMGPIPVPLFPPVVEDFGDEHERRDRCDFASSSFSVTNPALWYTINTTSYPNDVPLSLNGNHGFKEGDIVVTPTGLTINRPGDYWVNMTAILSYVAPAPPPQALTPIPAVGDQFIIPVFVVRDGEFDPNEEDQLSGIGIFPASETHIEDIQGNGIMANIKEGTKLSLVAMNSGTSDETPIPLQVLAWSISLHRICD